MPYTQPLFFSLGLDESGLTEHRRARVDWLTSSGRRSRSAAWHASPSPPHITTLLPTACLRANKFLAWDARELPRFRAGRARHRHRPQPLHRKAAA